MNGRADTNAFVKEQSMRGVLWAATLAGLFGLLGTQGRGAAPPEVPPYRRVLRGEEARQAKRLRTRAEQAEAAGKYAEAEAAYRAEAVLRARRQGARHWQAREAGAFAAFARQVGRLSAEERQSLAKALQVVGPALLLVRQGRYAEARAGLEKSLAVVRELLGEDNYQASQLHKLLGLVLTAQARYTEAQASLRKGMEIAGKVLGQDHPDIALASATFADNLREQGKYLLALQVARRALAHARRARGPNHQNTAGCAHTLAMTLMNLHRHDEAQRLLEAVLAIYRKEYGENAVPTVGARNDLANNLLGLSRFAQAESMARLAVAGARQASGEQHPKTATTYNTLSHILGERGKNAEAELLQRKCLAIRRATLGELHPETTSSYNNLAIRLDERGERGEAEILYRTAQHIERLVLGERHPNCIHGLGNLADNLNRQGKYKEAETLWQQALKQARQVWGEAHLGTARFYTGLGDNAKHQRKYAQADRLYRKALGIYRDAWGERHVLTSQLYNNLATNLRNQNKHAESEPLLRKSLVICLALVGEEHPNTATVTANLAWALFRQGKYAPAEAAATDAARRFEAIRLLGSFTGLQRAAASANSPLPLLAALRARNGKPALAWQALESSLARALLDDVANRRSLYTHDERRQEDEMRARFQRLGQQMAALAPAGSEKARAERTRLRRQQEKVLDELNECQLASFRKHGAAAGQVYAFDKVQSSLPPNAALVTWLDLQGERWGCVVRRRGEPRWVRLPGSGPRGAWTVADLSLPAKVRASLQRPDGDWRKPARQLYQQRLAPLTKHLGAREKLPAVTHLIVLPSGLDGLPIEGLVAARPEGRPAWTISYAPSGTLFAYLQERRAKEKVGRTARLLALGDPTFAEVAAPAPLPTPPDHGVLLALVQPRSNAARAGVKAGDVLLRYDRTRLSKPADLLAALRKRAGEKPGKKPNVEVTLWRAGRTCGTKVFPGMLGVVPHGGPAAEGIRIARAAESVLAGTRAGFQPLPGTRREVRAIARLFDKPEVLLGGKASEAKLEELGGALRAYRYLHFATHGMSSSTRPLDSFLALASKDLPDPLKRILAGKTAHTGRLTAGHILNAWKLDAELVVLSACQTGLGKHEHGEGYLGFAQALFLAGARSLVLSQWSVDDEGTALLMVRFYQNLLGKRNGLKNALGKAEALREAKEWLRNLSAKEAKVAVASLPRGKVVPRKPAGKGSKPFAHPYYWAGFILIGDPL
jgi:CHAT domain-containing protein